MARMAAITPAESIGTFLQIVGAVFAVAIVTGSLKASIGLAILWLPSVQAFFRYQRMGSSSGDACGRMTSLVDALNAKAGGGEPRIVEQSLGSFKLRSGALLLGDPQYMPQIEVTNVTADEVAISAKMRQYPSGGQTLATLTLRLGDESEIGPLRKIGHVAIDSGKLVVADKADFEEYWTQVGKERVGVISTARNDSLLRKLTKRFKLETIRVNAVRAEVVGPVSEQLQKEIVDYLKSYKKYADFPFLYFRVETNNSFDRVNHLERSWDFMPVGNVAKPLMFACETGHGDGVYDVQCRFAGDVPRIVTIVFIETADGDSARS